MTPGILNSAPQNSMILHDARNSQWIQWHETELCNAQRFPTTIIRDSQQLCSVITNSNQRFPAAMFSDYQQQSTIPSSYVQWLPTAINDSQQLCSVITNSNQRFPAALFSDYQHQCSASPHEAKAKLCSVVDVRMSTSTHSFSSTKRQFGQLAPDSRNCRHN
jgi:hypothetical protein